MARSEDTGVLRSMGRKPDVLFYASWVLLTLLCIPVAFFLDLAILRIVINVVGDFIYVDGVRHITEDYLGVYVFVPMVGLLTGLLQYGLLRRYLPRMGWWVLATTGGWLLGVLAIGLPGRLNWAVTFSSLDVMFVVMGLSIGGAQWLVLRRRVPQAGWWIAASVLGWGLMGLITAGNSLGQDGLLMLGLFPACTTAAMLALLMNRT